jgi:hypothetical protein
MTDDDIRAIAEPHAQYLGSQALTLRGQGVIDFARDLIVARDAENLALEWPVIEETTEAGNE